MVTVSWLPLQVPPIRACMHLQRYGLGYGASRRQRMVESQFAGLELARETLEARHLWRLALRIWAFNVEAIGS